MKKLSIAYIVFAFIILLVISLKAENISGTKKENVIKNLSMGLSSENRGLRVSSALVLGQLIDAQYFNGENSDAVLFPLMSMLTKGYSDEERIAAALALFKAGDYRGIYRLKGSAKYDDSKRVKDICCKLYYEFNKQNGTEYLLSN